MINLECKEYCENPFIYINQEVFMTYTDSSPTAGTFNKRVFTCVPFSPKIMDNSGGALTLIIKNTNVIF